MARQTLLNVNQFDKDSIEKAFDINARTEKIITFVFPSIQLGTFGPQFTFPLNGTITKIEASCTKTSQYDTIFDIEIANRSEIIACNEEEQSLILPNGIMSDNDDTTKMALQDMPSSILVTPWHKIGNSSILKHNFFSTNYNISSDKISTDNVVRVNFIQVSDGSANAETAEGVTVQITIVTDDNY